MAGTVYLPVDEIMLNSIITKGRNTLGQTGLFPMNYTSPEKPPANTHRIVSYNDDIYQHTRMSSGTSSATISSDECRTTSTIHSAQSTEDITNVPTTSTSNSFGVSTLSPIDWNMEEVVTWLESVGLESFADSFIGRLPLTCFWSNQWLIHYYYY